MHEGLEELREVEAQCQIKEELHGARGITCCGVHRTRESRACRLASRRFAVPLLRCVGFSDLRDKECDPEAPQMG